MEFIKVFVCVTVLTFSSSMAAVSWLMFLIACIISNKGLSLSQPLCIQSKCSSPSSQETYCKCDSECTLYNDCCLDYSPANETNQPNSILYELMECLEVNHTRHVLSPGGNSVQMVSRCPQPSELAEKCTDRSLFLPVTHSHLNFTFRNLYCAMCNQFFMEQLKVWQPQFYCDDRDVFMNFATFEEINRSCFMYDIVLEGDHSRSCIPHVSTCPSNSNVDLKEGCVHGPFDLITALDSNTRIFKNSACAKCNGITATMCLIPEIDTNMSVKPISSEKLVNVTWDDALTVPIRLSLLSCEDKIFDPNSGKCVPLMPPPETPSVEPARCVHSSCEHEDIRHLERACFCDEQCELYRDCCYDAVPVHRLLIDQIYKHVTCQQTNFELTQRRNNSNVFTAIEAFLMVSSCPSEWISTQKNEKLAEEIVFKCSNSLLLPQTDPDSKFTFRNSYCAQCYNVNLTNLIAWRAEYDCDVNTTLDAKALQLRSIEDVAIRCKLVKYIHEPFLSRHCFPHVSTCSNLTNSDLTRKCQTEGLELYQEGLSNGSYVRLFRNSYCADCNGVGEASRTCFQVELPPLPIFVGPGDFSFVTFLDVAGTGNKQVRITLKSVVECEQNQLFDKALRQCREKYVSINNETMINCTTPLALNSSEYEPGEDNNTLVFQEILYTIIDRDPSGRPVICTNFTRFGTDERTVNSTRTPVAFIYITYVTTSLSILGSIAILITYSIFKQLRSLPSKILMNLAVGFLVGDILILLFYSVSSSISPLPLELTATMAIFLHFFLLSRFSWMSIMSFETCRVFYLAVKLQSDIAKRSKTILLVVYLLIGWCIPFVITSVTIIVNYTTDDLVWYGETSNGSAGAPWINHRPLSAAVAFVAPAVLALLFNAAAFATAVILLCKAAGRQSDNHNSDKSFLASYWKYIRISGALFSVMGITWVFGLLALIPALNWAWYPFLVFSSSQALWIAIAFLLTTKIIKLYISLFRRAMSRFKKATNDSKNNHTKSSKVQSI